MLQIIVPMAIFTLTVALLAFTVLMVRARLTIREPVSITVNERQALTVISGDTLLATLGEQGIQLPAACGGRGACGQCRVQIEGTVTPLLPTELNHIHRRDAAAGMRLACMVKVREDMQVRVPENVLEAQRCACRVVTNNNISTFLKQLVLELPEGVPFKFTAGDYVLLEAPAGKVDFGDFKIDAEYQQAWQSSGVSDRSVSLAEPTVRAYSLANPPGEQGRLMLVVRIALPPHGAQAEIPPGMVSSYIFSLRPGDQVSVTGPFGDFHAREGESEMIFVGGGAGIAPMRSIIHDQLIGRGARRKISFWYGSRNVRELCFYDEFSDLAARYENFSYHVALSGPGIEPTWQGDKGFIHTVLFEKYLRTHPSPEQVQYYLCGPPLMSAATLAMLEDLGVDRDNVLFDDFGSG
jgi:Na+-transporting NADH:ubiquinone oxidoreductase subunit F